MTRQPFQYVTHRAPFRDDFVRNRDMKFIFERHPGLDAIEAVRVQFFKRGRIRDVPVKAQMIAQ